MRLAKRVLVLSLLFVGTMVTGVASAQQQAPCRDNGSTYAGSSRAGLATDKAQAPVGELVTLRGCGYRGVSQVAHTMHSHTMVLGSATTDANGDYTFQFRVPADAEVGNHTITATGVNAAGATRTQSIPFTVTAAAAAQAATTTTVAGEAARTTATTARAAAANSTLPRTGGGSTMPQVVGGVALVGIGAALVVIARRRRSATSAA